MIKLIVSDIDGTLVPEGNTDLNPEYLEVIKKLTEKGIVFAAASGRHASSIHAVFQPVGERIYYVSENGACIEKNGKEDEQPQSSEPDEDRCQRNCGRLRDES